MNYYVNNFLYRQRSTNHTIAANINMNNPKRMDINDTPYPPETIAGDISLARIIDCIAKYRP